MSRNLRIPTFNIGTNAFIGHSYVSSKRISLSDAEKKAILETCEALKVRGAVLQTTPELVALFLCYDFTVIGVVGADIKPTKEFMETVTVKKILKEIQEELTMLHELSDLRVCLHGIITDALLRSENSQIMAEVLKEIQSTGTPAGAATHFPGDTLEKLQTAGADFCLCGFNPLGFMMKPSLDVTLEVLESRRVPIIAKKVMAGGWLTMDRVLPFLAEHKNLVDSCVVGVASPEEAENTFGALSTVFP
jgi:hypothetical protein